MNRECGYSITALKPITMNPSFSVGPTADLPYGLDEDDPDDVEFLFPAGSKVP